MAFDPRKVLWEMRWRPIEEAPRDGTHILAANFSRGSIGFGYMPGKPVPTPWQGVVHWWGEPGEEGFYLSSGLGADEAPVQATHWMPLLDENFYRGGGPGRGSI